MFAALRAVRRPAAARDRARRDAFSRHGARHQRDRRHERPDVQHDQAAVGGAGPGFSSAPTSRPVARRGPRLVVQRAAVQLLRWLGAADPRAVGPARLAAALVWSPSCGTARRPAGRPGPPPPWPPQRPARWPPRLGRRAPLRPARGRGSRCTSTRWPGRSPRSWACRACSTTRPCPGCRTFPEPGRERRNRGHAGGRHGLWRPHHLAEHPRAGPARRRPAPSRRPGRHRDGRRTGGRPLRAARLGGHLDAGPRRGPGCDARPGDLLHHGPGARSGDRRVAVFAGPGGRLPGGGGRPLAVGFLHTATGGWTVPIFVLLGICVAEIYAGLLAGGGGTSRPPDCPGTPTPSARSGPKLTHSHSSIIRRDGRCARYVRVVRHAESPTTMASAIVCFG